MWPDTRPLSRVAVGSICPKTSLRQNSAIPRPMALPCVAAAEPADGDPFHLRPLVGDRLVVIELAAHHVRVHARAADVLADAVDQEHVGPCKRQPRQPALGQHQQIPLAGLELGGHNGLDARRLIVSVFHHRQAGQDVAAAEHFAGHAADDLLETEILDGAVVDLRPFAVAQADQEHFHQAAFDRAGKARVRLDAVANHDVVGFEGQAVEVDRKAFGGAAQNDRFHTGADRAAGKLFRHAVRLDQFPLTFGRAAAVAAHRRHKEWIGPQAF